MKLSGVATKLAAEFSRGNERAMREIEAIFGKAEAIKAPRAKWRKLDEKKRGSLIAYLVDDSKEYHDHRDANLVCLALLLRAENGEKP